MSDAINQAFGGDPSVTLATQIGTMAKAVEDIANDMKDAKDTDTARYVALKAELDAKAATLSTLKDKYDADVRETEVKAALDNAAEMRKYLQNVREPSKAGLISGGRQVRQGSQRGDFIAAVAGARGRDAEGQAAGKAVLREMGLEYQESWGKATLGTTDATGGWIIPNAIVDDLIKPPQVKNVYRTICTVVEGVTAFAVDIPFRSAARNRAVIAAFGATKENVDLAYNGYTATMYTLARIHDVSNQFLRQSRGAAETDIIQELGAAFAVGEAYYIREGSGSSQPFGYTSALNNAQPAFRSSFTPATTLVGSIAASIATAAGALAGRGVTPSAAVLSAASYWHMVAQGTDTAGFFFSPAGGPTDIRPGTLMSPFGIPVYYDAQADLENTAAVVDNLIVGDWKRIKLYFGESYRVDSSDQAGTRWDTNETGWRGEEEMGVDCRPAVYAGYFQMIQDIEP